MLFYRLKLTEVQDTIEYEGLEVDAVVTVGIPINTEIGSNA